MTKNTTKALRRALGDFESALGDYKDNTTPAVVGVVQDVGVVSVVVPRRCAMKKPELSRLAETLILAVRLCGPLGEDFRKALKVAAKVVR